MPEPQPLKRGASCPNCNGDFKDALVPSAEQRRKATDRENPEPLPQAYDTASESVRAELGALARCTSCGYQTRFPIAKKQADKPAAE